MIQHSQGAQHSHPQYFRPRRQKCFALCASWCQSFWSGSDDDYTGGGVFTPVFLLVSVLFCLTPAGSKLRSLRVDAGCAFEILPLFFFREVCLFLIPLSVNVLLFPYTDTLEMAMVAVGGHPNTCNYRILKVNLS